MRTATAVAFGIAALAGLYLMWTAGWPVAAIGAASILSGIAYTGGPFPLGYHGLGDLFVMVFFGFVAVLGTVFVQTLSLPAVAWLSAISVGALATAILVVNNLRDRETDARVGKRTLAVRFGRRGAIRQYAWLVGIAHAVPGALLAIGYGPWGLLASLSTPFAIALVRQVATRSGARLNATLARTAQLLLVHGVLLALGIAFSG